MDIVRAINETRVDRKQRTIQQAVDLWCEGAFKMRSPVEKHIGFFCIDSLKVHRRS